MCPVKIPARVPAPLAPRSVRFGLVGAAALALIAIAIAVTMAGCEKSCRSGTLFLDVDLGGASAANTLDVDVTVDGKVTHSTQALPGGRASGGLEIAFPSGYPSGKTVTVALTARRDGAPIATASKAIPVGSGCTHTAIAFPAADAGAPVDASDAGSGDARDTGDSAGDGRGGQSGGIGGTGVGGAGMGGSPGAGGSGAGGSTMPGACTTARDFSYTFMSNTEGFALSTFDDHDQTNLGALPPPGPSLILDTTTNEPGGAAGSGSLKLTVNFTAYDQYVDVILDPSPALNLARKIGCAQVRLTSGSFTGGIHFHASSGAASEGYAGGATPTLTVGTWTTVPLNFDTPVTRMDPWLSSDVVELGIQIFTGDPPFAGVPYPATGPTVFHIDTIAD
jgi:hypothetical protein